MFKTLKGPSSGHVHPNKVSDYSGGGRTQVSFGPPAGVSQARDSSRYRGRIRALEKQTDASPLQSKRGLVPTKNMGSSTTRSGASYEKSSLKDLISGSSRENSGVTISHQNVRQIEVKPSPEEKTKNSKALVCDKCDGKHETDSCPHFKKARENHPDARRGGKQLGGSSKLPGDRVRGRVARQPGDGSCLFHSLSHGLKDGSSASVLRRQICAFIADNPHLKIADTPLSDWVKWDSRCSVSQYARRMSGGAWGGGIEMAAVSKLKGVNVHVYEQCGGGAFNRISAFDHEDSPEKRPVVRVLYGGGVHYDALCV